VVSIYLDDCIQQRRLVRQLRAAGHLLYLPSELGTEGQDDEAHLVGATRLGAVLVTHNQKHFAPMHYQWGRQGRVHAGIVLVVQQEGIESKHACLDRVARLLTSEAARGQLMPLKVFDTEDRARTYVVSLTSPGSA
jgi:Domain of unknown function (DUF5615)